VPLSEHEQRLLEQLERALQDEDPKFASALQGARLRARLRLRLMLAGLGMLLGLAALVYGLVATHHLPALEIAGGAVFVGSAWIAWTCWRRMPAPGEIVPAVKIKQAPLPGRRRCFGGPVQHVRGSMRSSASKAASAGAAATRAPPADTKPRSSAACGARAGGSSRARSWGARRRAGGRRGRRRRLGRRARG
jgi:hypothetical protein